MSEAKLIGYSTTSIDLICDGYLVCTHEEDEEGNEIITLETIDFELKIKAKKGELECVNC